MSVSWVRWRQARAPPSPATLAYVASLDGRADALMLRAVLGDRIRPSCLLTLRLCTVLLQVRWRQRGTGRQASPLPGLAHGHPSARSQESLRAGLTLADVGLMMARGSGVGVTAPPAEPPTVVGSAPARRGGGPGRLDPTDPDAPSALEQVRLRRQREALCSALAAPFHDAAPLLFASPGALLQAVRKARRLAARSRRHLSSAPSFSSSRGHAAQYLALPPGAWHSPTLGPRAAPDDDAHGVGQVPPLPADPAPRVPGQSGAGGGGRPPAPTHPHSQKPHGGQQAAAPWNVGTRASQARARQAAAALQEARARRASQCSVSTPLSAPGAAAGTAAGDAAPACAAAAGSPAAPATRERSGSSVGDGTPAAAAAVELPSPRYPVDTGTLAFLPYHDAVAAHFRAVIGEHVRLALAQRAAATPRA